MKTLFSIGHSNHSADRLLELLMENEVDVVVDVRSAPYSRYSPQFDLPAIRDSVLQADLRYEHVPQLGGRPGRRDFYDADGHVLYARLVDSADFRASLAWVLAIAQKARVAILCSEEDPVRCHRWRLIGPAVEEAGSMLLHIRADGRLEPDRDVRLRDEALHPERYQLQLIDSGHDRWRSIKPVDRPR